MQVLILNYVYLQAISLVLVMVGMVILSSRSFNCKLCVLEGGDTEITGCTNSNTLGQDEFKL